MQTLTQHPLFALTTLGAHRLQSRLVLPPMASGTADEDGRVGAATLAHYRRLVGARHGVAFVEYTAVHPYGRSEERQLALYDDSYRDGYAALAATIRGVGALPGIQLTHAGGKTDAALIGRTPLGASALPIPAHGGELPAPAPMSLAEVDEVTRSFVAAALIAEDAGFAVIELHAAHGYFFNQWISPLTNQRTDAHGGSLAARARLLLELVATLRAQLRPETVIALRFPGQDRLPGGLTQAEAALLGQWLKAAGADLLDVSSGLGGWRRGRDQRGEGYLVDDAIALRDAVGLPVIGVGGVESLAYAEAALTRVDLLAVGRAVLANPQWPLPASEAA